ncbi:methylmalonyl Co-A mutase-associated GTPase MeaB, partial [Desulfotomaculum copahuensis]
GIIAVDPTSPFSGGALLGDRIRMQNHAVDHGVFIRSMGTRGSLGGLSHTTGEVIKAMDAFGFEWVIIETVGVGQAEIDIMHVADTTVVVLTPGAGDAIQTIKAGIMEIADIFVVNKCDLPGAARVAAEVEIMLDMQAGRLDWRPPVVTTSTLSDRGTADLLTAIDQHRRYLVQGGLFTRRRQTRAKDETLSLVNHRWQQLVQKKITTPGPVNDLLSAVLSRGMDPYTAAARIFSFLTAGGENH